MKKSLVFKSATFKSTLSNRKDITNFLEYLFLEISNNTYYDIFKNKKVTITDIIPKKALIIDKKTATTTGANINPIAIASPYKNISNII